MSVESPSDGPKSRLHLSCNTPKKDLAAELTLEGQPPSAVYRQTLSALLPQIAAGVNTAIEQSSLSPPRAIRQTLSTAQLSDEQECYVASVVSSLRGRAGPDQQHEAARFVKSLGSGKSTLGIRTGIGHVSAVAQLVDVDEPIVIHFGEEFKQTRADQRRDICQLVSHLSTVVDVYLVPTTLRLERWIAHAHGSDLPGSLIEQCSTGRGNTHGESEAVDGAIDRFDIDGGLVGSLRDIAATANETRTLNELESEAGVSRDTIHNRLHHLREFNLVTDTLSTEDSSVVSLTSTGRAYLDAVCESAGFQSTLENSLIQSGNSPPNMPCNPTAARSGGEGDGDGEDQDGWTRNRLPHLHEIRDVPKHRFDATTATVSESDLSVVDTDVTPLNDRGSPGLHFDHTNRRLLISAEYDNPMQWMVCAARALSSPSVLSWFFTENKLDTADCDRFWGLFDNHKVILRQLRCIGYLPDDATTIEKFRDNIAAARDDLLEHTQRLTQTDYPDELDRSEYRSQITKQAHGLAGLMAHLLDLVNIDLMREIRIPRYRKFDPNKQGEIVKTIGTLSSIQSTYGDATTYRQLYEHREGKRKQAIAVDTDFHDLYSELIGSIAIVGDFKSQKESFVQSLKSDLEPTEPHEDAPEFQLNLSIKGELSRSEYAQTVTALCKQKNLNPTPEAVSLLAGLCNSPYEVAEALNYFAVNDDRRSIDAYEVRFAVGHLGVDDILRGITSTPRNVTMALLEATQSLTRPELADRADVSDRSLRDHLPDLLELGLIEEAPAGYRFNLSFASDDRTSDRYPTYVVDPLRPEVHKAAKGLRIGYQHHFGAPVADDEFRSGVTSDTWCADLRDLDEADPWIRDVLPLLWNLECRDVYREDPDFAPLIANDDTTEVRLGPDVQSQLATYSEGATG